MATPGTAVALYNYEAFMGGESDFLAFRSKLPIGSQAPDFTAVALDSGEKVQLRDYWRDGDVVMETGTESMLHGAADSEGKFEVKIWE